MASLRIIRGPANEDEHIPLTKDDMIIGRNPDCHIHIPSPFLGRQHARLIRVGDWFYIDDTRSLSGTYVNNQQIHGQTLLQSGDRIQVCDFVAVFEE